MSHTSLPNHVNPLQVRRSSATALAITISLALPTTRVHAQVATVWGAKSCGSSAPLCGGVASAVPTHLFSFAPGIAPVTDHGPITLGAANVIIDGLAQSNVYGLLGFQLTTNTSGAVLGSRLVAIDTATATATAIGPLLTRDVRGAVFGKFGELYVLDTSMNSLLRIDPALGVEIAGSELPLSLSGGGAFVLGNGADIALRADGRYYVTSGTLILALHIETGVLTPVKTDAAQFLAGASFVSGVAADALYTFDVTGTDDLLRYDLDAPGVPSSIFASNILAFFNAGRGDLATVFPQQAPSYCTSGTTTNGCVASISANVNPNVAHTSGCVLTVANVEGQKSGIVFYGINGANNSPWCAGGSSVLCVKAPTQRMAVQSSGGAAGACNGALTQNWDAFQNVNPLALGNPWSIGSRAFVQAWFRDPPSCKTTSLSNAVELTYQP